MKCYNGMVLFIYKKDSDNFLTTVYDVIERILYVKIEKDFLFEIA